MLDSNYVQLRNIENSFFVKNVYAYKLKSKHINRDLSKLFLDFFKSNQVVITNFIVSIFHLRRSFLFLIELTYNKGFTFIFGDLIKKNKRIRNVNFFRYLVSFNIDSVINGFITNNDNLYNIKYELREAKYKNRVKKYLNLTTLNFLKNIGLDQNKKLFLINENNNKINNEKRIINKLDYNLLLNKYIKTVKNLIFLYKNTTKTSLQKNKEYFFNIDFLDKTYKKNYKKQLSNKFILVSIKKNYKNKYAIITKISKSKNFKYYYRRALLKINKKKNLYINSSILKKSNSFFFFYLFDKFIKNKKKIKLNKNLNYNKYLFFLKLKNLKKINIINKKIKEYYIYRSKKSKNNKYLNKIILYFKNIKYKFFYSYFILNTIIKNQIIFLICLNYRQKRKIIIFIDRYKLINNLLKLYYKFKIINNFKFKRISLFSIYYNLKEYIKIKEKFNKILLEKIKENNLLLFFLCLNLKKNIRNIKLLILYFLLKINNKKIKLNKSINKLLKKIIKNKILLKKENIKIKNNIKNLNKLKIKINKRYIKKFNIILNKLNNTDIISKLNLKDRLNKIYNNKNINLILKKDFIKLLNKKSKFLEKSDIKLNFFRKLKEKKIKKEINKKNNFDFIYFKNKIIKDFSIFFLNIFNFYNKFKYVNSFDNLNILNIFIFTKINLYLLYNSKNKIIENKIINYKFNSLLNNNYYKIISKKDKLKKFKEILEKDILIDMHTKLNKYFSIKSFTSSKDLLFILKFNKNNKQTTILDFIFEKKNNNKLKKDIMDKLYLFTYLNLDYLQNFNLINNFKILNFFINNLFKENTLNLFKKNLTKDYVSKFLLKISKFDILKINKLISYNDKNNSNYLKIKKEKVIQKNKFENLIDIYTINQNNLEKTLFFKYFYFFIFNFRKNIKERYNSYSILNRLIFKQYDFKEKISVNLKDFEKEKSFKEKSKLYLNKTLLNLFKHRLYSKYNISKIKEINTIMLYYIIYNKYLNKDILNIINIDKKNKEINNKIFFFKKFIYLNLNYNKKIFTKIDKFKHKNKIKIDIKYNHRISDCSVFLDSDYGYWFFNEFRLYNISVISFIQLDTVLYNVDFPIPIQINNENRLFFFNLILRVIFIGYKKLLLKFNFNNIKLSKHLLNYKESFFFERDNLLNVY